LTTFAEKQQALIRTPVTLVCLTIDVCALTFGVAPCTASGEACYNTFPTCKDRVNYNRSTVDYDYATTGTQPSFPGARPYVKNVRMLPTEITDTLAVKGRVSVTMVDEPELTDVGLDPYVSTRTTAPKGSYWNKWLARNANYQARPAAILEGYEGLPRSEYVDRWRGQIEGISVARGTLVFSFVDPLKALDNISIPPELEIELVAPVSMGDTTMTVTGDVDSIPDAGHLRIEDEIVSYTAINRTSNVISGMTRALFDSIAVSADAGDAIKLVLYIAPVNPFDLVYRLINNDPDPSIAYPDIPGGGIPAASIDADAFDYWKDHPGGEPLVGGLIESPTDIKNLVVEVLTTIDAAIWYDETQRVTIRRNLPNDPGTSFVTITDAANIIDNSGSAKLNDESRNTRVTLYWERRGVEDPEKTTNYRRITQSRDVDAESANEYGDIRELTIKSRLMSSTIDTEETTNGYAAGTTARRLFRTRDANPIITIEVERKDGDILTGTQIAITTDELLTADGSPLVSARGIVTKRDPSGDKIKLTCTIYHGPRYLVIAPDEFPDDFADGNTDQQEYGCITDDTGRVDGSPGYAFF
jgi:hypothetical protein